MELQKQIGWSRTRPRMYFYRTQTGHEVDVVLEDSAGNLVGIEIKGSATVNFGPGATTYSGNLGNWQTGDFKITYSNGDLTLKGQTGAGILLVDGNLKTQGSGWNYVGYVFVTGGIELRNSTAPEQIWGATFIGGNTTRDLYLKGPDQIRYSSQALSLVMNAFATYTVRAITEP